MATENGTTPAPTTERGSIATGILPGWSRFYIEESEYVPEWRFPNQVKLVVRMLADAKIKGLSRSLELPLMSRQWAVDPNGADEESVRLLADDLDLPIVGEDRKVRRRQRNRFNFSAHLPIALRALWFGFYYFEQVAPYDETSELFRLRKLAPRPPRTISEINVEKDGGLYSIRQHTGSSVDGVPPELTVNQLLCYVWEYEGGNWTGTSMLRSCYRNWLLKDRLMRVDAVKHERAGVGMPLAEAPPGASEDEIARLGEMMRALKVTEEGGGAVPAGTKAQLMGTTGSLPDTIASIRLHNEEINSSWLAEFKNLGQGQAGGSYALGKVDYDFFGLALDAVEQWVLDTFNPFMIEDWYDWNYGQDSQPARLVVEEEPDPLDQMDKFEQGLDQSDKAAEAEVEAFAEKAKAKLRREKRARSARLAGRSGARAAASPEVDSPSLLLPDRALRRQPYDHEVMAAVDYQAIDAHLTAQVDDVVEQIQATQAAQVDDIVAQIKKADGDLAKLAALRPAPTAEDLLFDAMTATAQVGMDAAAKEAKEQGLKKPTKAKLADLTTSLRERAAATDALLADSFGQAASRQALRRTAAGVPTSVVADGVRAYLGTLKTGFLEAQANGVLVGALNDGRLATMRPNKPTKVYASELLDEATCDACTEVDGTEYKDVDEATLDYPTGGYVDCQGQERCRGTLVAVYGES